ncbi:MAG: SMP-30/gluconolactonase/LRE family protein [Deltaproteobacteria bacterium]
MKSVKTYRAELALKAEAIVGESPVWSVPEKALYWVDITRGQVHRYRTENNSDTVYQLPQPVSALCLRERGGLVLALRDGFAFYDPPADRLTMISDPEAGLPDNRFNDAKCDRQGRFWGGTMSDTEWDKPSGSLYRLGTDLSVTRVIPDVVCSNGMGWSPEGGIMYHTESFRYAVFKYDFEVETGAVSNRRVFAEVDKSTGAFPDGLTVDSEGCVWSVHNAAGSVVRYDTSGRAIAEVEVPVPRPCGCIFGGEKMDRLFITTARETMSGADLKKYLLSGSVFVVEPGVAGLPEPYFKG